MVYPGKGDRERDALRTACGVTPQLRLMEVGDPGHRCECDLLVYPLGVPRMIFRTTGSARWKASLSSWMSGILT